MSDWGTLVYGGRIERLLRIHLLVVLPNSGIVRELDSLAKTAPPGFPAKRLVETASRGISDFSHPIVRHRQYTKEDFPVSCQVGVG